MLITDLRHIGEHFASGGTFHAGDVCRAVEAAEVFDGGGDPGVDGGGGGDVDAVGEDFCAGGGEGGDQGGEGDGVDVAEGEGGAAGGTFVGGGGADA